MADGSKVYLRFGHETFVRFEQAHVFLHPVSCEKQLAYEEYGLRFHWMRVNWNQQMLLAGGSSQLAIGRRRYRDGTSTWVPHVVIGPMPGIQDSERVVVQTGSLVEPLWH